GCGTGCLDHLFAVNVYIREVRVAKQADDARLVWDHFMPLFQLVIFGMDLPRLPDKVDAIGDFGYQGFAETESPVVVFVIGCQSDGVVARVGGVIPGVVVVGGPVEELEMRIGADRVDVKEIRHAELAETDLEMVPWKLFEER